MRVAVIFFGQPRNLRNPLSPWSHKRWLHGIDVDYFGHCWFSKELNTKYRVGDNVVSYTINSESIEILRKKYPRIILNIENPKEFTLDEIARIEDLNLKHLDEETLRLLPIFYSQFYSIDQALKLLDEKTRKTSYDLIILSRYDNFIAHLPNPRKVNSRKLNIKRKMKADSGFPDLIFMGDRDVIEGINVLPRFKILLEDQENTTPEKLKEKSFLMQFSQSQLVENNFEIQIIRDTAILKHLIYFIRVKMHVSRKRIFT